MNGERSSTIYACPSLVTWVKDVNQIIVIDEKGQQQHFLRGLEAIVWSWLTLSYTYEVMLKLIEELLMVPAMEAEERLSSFLTEWQRKGLLEIVDR